MLHTGQHKYEECHEYEHTWISFEQRERRGFHNNCRKVANNHDAWPVHKDIFPIWTEVEILQK